MKFHSACWTAVALVLASTTTVVQAFSTGAGGCAGGMAAVQGAHLARSSIVTGDVEGDGGYTVTVPDAIALDTATELTVSGTTPYRGILMRVVPSNGGIAVETSDANLQLAGVCTEPGVVGLTHNSPAEKTESSMTLTVSDADAGASVTLDVTIVVSNSEAAGSVYYYQSYTIPVMADEVEETTAPTMAPVMGMTTMTEAPVMAALPSIAEIATGDEQFSTLVTAVTTAGIDLTQDGPLTVFAPPNTAFDMLDQALVAKLLTPAWLLHLTTILTFHVVAGDTRAAMLTDGLEIETLEGEDLDVSVDPMSGAVSLSTEDGAMATVTTADIAASNGVVHVIDAVLLPEFAFVTLYDLISMEEDFSTLLSLVDTAGLQEALMSADFTLLAPTNEAFGAVDPDTLAMLQADNALLTQVLLYHLVPGVVTSSAITSGPVTSQNGPDSAPLTFTVNDDMSIMVDDATVTDADELAINGVLHEIDMVLIPADLMVPNVTAAPAVDTGMMTDTPVMAPVVVDGGMMTEAPAMVDPLPRIVNLLEGDQFTTLATAVEAAGLGDSLDTDIVPVTVFAPTDDVFADFDQDLLAKLLEPEFQTHLITVLSFHVTLGSLTADMLTDGRELPTFGGDDDPLGGEMLLVSVDNDTGAVSLSSAAGAMATVTVADALAVNGVVHEIDNILLPSFAFETVYSIIANDEQFSTLASLVNMTDLGETLMTADLTLFAPTNDAFAAVDEATLELLLNDTALLTKVLAYHAVPMVVASMDVAPGTVESANGPGSSPLTITVIESDDDETPATVMVDDATVTAVDALALNGVVHTIDMVLVPDDLMGTPMPVAVAVTDAPAMAPTDVMVEDDDEEEDGEPTGAPSMALDEAASAAVAIVRFGSVVLAAVAAVALLV